MIRPGLLFRRLRVLITLLCGLVLMAGCDQPAQPEESEQPRDSAESRCDPDNGSLILPPGFCARVVADNLGFIRHLAVNDNGDIYVTLRNRRLNLGGLMALRDNDGDGRMEQIGRISEEPGMGIALRNNVLYFGTDVRIYRYQVHQPALLPPGPPDILVDDLPEQALHAGKTIALDNNNRLYVNIGAPSNACQPNEDYTGSAGLDPCPELAQQAGIWRFATDQIGQTQDRDGERYASGIRNAYAMDWHDENRELYIVQHGRDQMNSQWPELYTELMAARLPAEEFLRVGEGSVHSWPYCYYDQLQGLRVLAPEYGGDTKKVGDCDRYPDPVMAFPGHYGPNDLMFYYADQFPARYQHGAFIAFHGSYNRGSLGQVGYQVVFVPFRGAEPAGEWEVFADGFAGDDKVLQPEDAEYRPTGLAVGPDGSLYISDSVQGRIWQVTYVGP